MQNKDVKVFDFYKSIRLCLVTLLAIFCVACGGKPVAESQSDVTVLFETPALITLKASNSPISWEVTQLPANGTLSGDAPNITYSPNQGYLGPDFFKFTASNDKGTSDEATISLNVIPVVDGAIETPPAPAPMPTLSAQSIIASDSVGTTVGKFRVDETGAANYHIPLIVPTGTAGVAPSLSLNYSSSGGNGLLGLGWSVGGLSSISRCAQTLATDGQALSVNWSSDDRFCYNGQRLVLAEDSPTSYGRVGAIYKTEIDSFVRITSHGGTTGNPHHFTVAGKDGSVSTFGDTNNSAQVGAAGFTYTWAINQFADSVGNEINFSYHNDADGFSVKQIDYAYGAGSTPNASIEFEYQPDSRPDPVQGYLSGVLFSNNRLLENISVKNNGDSIRDYYFGYLPSDGISNLSKLEWIQECSPSTCLPKTTFEWVESDFGLSDATSEVSLPGDGRRNVASFKPGDINGDGYMDLVWVQKVDHDTGRLRYLLSDGTKLVPAYFHDGSSYVETYFSSVSDLDIIDYNADGFMDVAINKVRVYLSKPYAEEEWRLDPVHLRPAGASEGEMLADSNSDGLIDVYAIDRFFPNFGIRIHLMERNEDEATTSNQFYQFHPYKISSENIRLDIIRLFNREAPWEGASYDRRAYALSGAGDFDGDGVMDLIVYDSMWRDTDGWPFDMELVAKRDFIITSTAQGFSIYDQIGTQLPNTSNNTPVAIMGLQDKAMRQSDLQGGITGLHKGATFYADFNGDGLSDLVFQSGKQGDAVLLGYRLNNGNGFDEFEPIGSFPSIENDSYMRVPQPDQLQLVDFNGDGKTDIVWHDRANRALKCRLWNGNGFNQTFIIKSTNGDDEINHMFLDVDGDARIDYVRVGDNRVSTTRNIQQNVPTNKITHIINGWGEDIEIQYESMPISDHYDFLSDGSAQFYHKLNSDWEGSHSIGKQSPIFNATAPIYVVTSVASSAPVISNLNNTYNIDYYYYNAKLQAGGRGLLGFESVASIDRKTGIETTTTYRQDFPFRGYPVATTVKNSLGHLLSESTNHWELNGWQANWPDIAFTEGTAELGPLQPFIQESVEKTYAYDQDQMVQGELVSTVTTNYTYDSEGNAETVAVNTQDLTGLNATTTTVNTYGTSSWEKRLGRLSRTEVTFERVNEDPQTRTTEFTYYTAGTRRGLLKQEIVEPDNPTLRLTTEYIYDRFGNKQKMTKSGQDVEDRVTEWVYDDDGRYVDETYNSYGQLTREVLSRNSLGLPTSVKDINGVESQTVYGSMGRPYLKYTADGNSTQTLYQWCDAQCPATGVYFTQSISADGQEAKEYFDLLGRTIGASSRSFDGTWIHQDTHYDEVGRVQQKSDPYFSGVSPYYTSFTYDALGRVKTTGLPGGTTISVTYDGLTKTATTSPLLTTKTEVSNALGELVELKGDESMTYRYDAAGNLRFVIDAQTNSVEMRYDLLGRKYKMIDPDKGTWDYVHNVFGELEFQTDAKGQTSDPEYDRLGRMVSRVDRRFDGSIESDTVWVYNNDTAGTVGKALGALEEVADRVSDYKKAYTYDALGRLDKTITQLAINDIHYERTTYDQFGRTFQVFDAAGYGTWTDNAVKNEYNAYGYLRAVKDALMVDGQSKTTYYEVLEMDARGNVTKYLSGNGVTTDKEYYEDSGLLKSIRSFGVLSVLGDIQDQTYVWDELGNLENRSDNSGNKDLFESFGYDGMNRLTSSQVQGRAAIEVRYNEIGNITYKSDVGDYDYEETNGAGPHAVSGTGDGVEYHYDNNGNLTHDTSSGPYGGRTITYTTFDKPDKIIKAGHTTEFKYGPERARYLRVDNNSNGQTITRYVGSVEKINGPNGRREIKRYLPGNVLVTINLDQEGIALNTDTKYLYKDYLGSLDVITDDQGNILQELSFDAWGQRRQALDWSQLSAIDLQNFDHSLTTRGFTGHEMLDEVGLIHMNGRIYDPRLGRFVQADSIIQAPSDSQMYNRYSYIRNNPVNGVDPSGHIAFIAAVFVGYAIGVVAAAFDNPTLAAIGGIIACSTGNPVGCAAGFAFGATLGSGGSFQDAVKNGLIAGASAYAFQSVGGEFTGDGGFFEAGTKGGFFHIAAHGLTGGIISVAQGGKFGHGFVSAGVAKAATPAIANIGGDAFSINGVDVAEVIAAATIGGTVSNATGGKFANGAITAAFGNMFNEQASRAKEEQLTHEYEMETEICSTSYSECTAENVWSALKDNSVPFQKGTLTDGTVSKIPGIGTVTTRVDNDNYTLVNQTHDDHFFKHGTVTRSLVISESAISVRTIGVGTNTNYVSWGANYVASPYFKVLDMNIKATISMQQFRHDYGL